MNEDALNDLATGTTERFVEECKRRGENPREVLERLLLDYIRGDDLESMIEDIHAHVVDGGTPLLVDDEPAPDVDLLEEYDPRGEGKLTEEALEQLVKIDQPIAINPAHVTEEALPQDTQIKREVIKAIARHEHAVAKKCHVKKIAKELLDVGDGYRRREYITPVWNELTVLDSSSVPVTFLSDVDSALAWIDEQLAERGADAETDLYWLASELWHSETDLSDEALNARLNEISLSVDGLHSPE